MKVFSVYDCKAEAFMQPFFMLTRGLAIRGIQDCMNDSNHQFSKYPGDFTLFEISDWDESTGSFKQDGAKVNLGTCLELKGSSPTSSVAPLVSN